ncbi:type I restriction-modification system subunit M [Lentisalinibacter orientalis]|uniref:type I restriction-modification system subunit M n=1 Tax=Lentisalinibacter orientalis TaxID=2992241 RepID=UPI003868A111
MVDGDVEQRLWAAADQLWANTGLRPSQFSVPVLGLVFLRYAEKTYAEVEEKLGPLGSGGRRKVSKTDYIAEGVIFLPEKARFSYLQSLPEDANLGKALNDAMKAIEVENTDLKGALPKTYTQIENWVLVELLRLLAPVDLTGDAFGKVYEYFLGKFAMKEGQKGGVFYTPESIVKLIVEIIEPYHGEILDPACGSGGMFVHSAKFVERHKKDPTKEINIYGVEKDATTVNLNKMNLAVHGLSGYVRVANSYYEDPFDQVGKFDFVMANPPFNVSGVDKERLEGDPRFPFGMPRPDNANYLWIQQFYSALNARGRAGFVMANSAGDARASDQTIRQKLIEAGIVDAIVSVGPNMFYTVTLPCTLWFLDRGKVETSVANTVLFVDARHIYRQVDRAHRDWTPAQIGFLANLVRLYRNENPDLAYGGDDAEAKLKEVFGEALAYSDFPGLCKAATLQEIEEQGWSLNPGRYVGVAPGEDVSNEDFREQLEMLSEEFEFLSAQARELEESIAKNVAEIMVA